MDRNKMKRKIAMMLCVCVLFASSAPLALAEAEATPSEPTRAALKLTRITPGNGTLEVELTGTAGQNVTVDLTTMDEEDVASQTVTLSASLWWSCLRKQRIASINRKRRLTQMEMPPCS